MILKVIHGIDDSCKKLLLHCLNLSKAPLITSDGDIQKYTSNQCRIHVFVLWAEKVILKFKKRAYSKLTKNLVHLLRYKCCVINKIKISEGSTNQKMLKRNGSVNSFIDSCGILRAGGGIEKSTLDESVTHAISWRHQKAVHSERNITLNEIRSSK